MPNKDIYIIWKNTGFILVMAAIALASWYFLKPMLFGLILMSCAILSLAWFNKASLALYILRRIFIFIPTFLIVSVMAFFITQNSPYDPVDTRMNAMSSSGGIGQTAALEKDRNKVREELGLNRPVFYVRMSTMADCDTLYNVKHKAHKENLHHLTRKYGNWQNISKYYLTLMAGADLLNNFNADSVHAAFGKFVQPEITKDSVFIIMTSSSSRQNIDSSALDQLISLNPTQYIKLDDTLLNDYIISNHTVIKTDKNHAYIYYNNDTISTPLYILKDSFVANYTFRKDSVINYAYSNEDISNGRNIVLNSYNRLLNKCDDQIITETFDTLTVQINSRPYLSGMVCNFQELCITRSEMQTNTSKWKNYIPSLDWNGIGNQYHQWLFGTKPWFTSGRGNLGLLRGDFGLSYVDGKPVKTNLIRKFKISLELVFFSILIAYFVSLPIGIYAAYKKDSLFDRSSGIILFVLYSMPNFFVALLLINLFANPDNLLWFYGTGSRPDGIIDAVYFEKMTYLERLKMSWPYMVLPLVTYTYAMFAFISRIMRVGMLETLEQDYIRTARSKGLSEKTVILKHALKNSLLPIITIFANIFPLAVGGSVIVEYIFNYKGMGSLTLDAINNGDYPYIIAIFCIAGILTMVGYLVSDVLYAIIDPRISLGKKK